MKKYWFLFACFLAFGLGYLYFDITSHEPYKTLPVAYNGRFVPLDVYAKQYLQDFYGKQQIKKSDLPAFHLKGVEALPFFLQFYFYGHEPFDEAPLFSIHYAELKKILGVELKKERFSYNQIKDTIFNRQESNLRLMHLLIPYFFIKHDFRSSKEEINELAKGLLVGIDGPDLILLQAPNFSPWNFLKPGMVIAKNIKEERSFFEKIAKPYIEEAVNLFAKINRYQSSNIEFKVLPSKKTDVWQSLELLDLKKNWTSYSDAVYKRLQTDYKDLQQSPKKEFEPLGNALYEAYGKIAGTPSKEAYKKVLSYPTTLQLKAEFIYYQYPFIKIAIIFYLLALINFILGKTLKKEQFNRIAFMTLSLAFIFHTLVLGLRCFILNRPPVSNMFETVIYVPWITMIAGFIFCAFFKNKLLLIASTFCALVLLILLEVTGMNERLENVQAVLDSNYWLIVHVLLIVGSYGVFFLSGVLGAFYLMYDYFNLEVAVQDDKVMQDFELESLAAGVDHSLKVKAPPTTSDYGSKDCVNLSSSTAFSRFKKEETEEMKFLEKFILQTLYLGCFMLIPGTILGGVWAAESWGRFWDWDPKESWAFISSCIYLIWIHAYRFHKIAAFGLAVGSVIGLLAISFTWYGVNYILGTGLHSYGFGSGKDFYYYLFLISVTSLLTIVFYRHIYTSKFRNRHF